MIKFISRFFGSSSEKQNEFLINQLRHIIGFKPSNVSLYFLALKHNSFNKQPASAVGMADNNERLEFLGDAVLGMVVADLLFKKYPMKDEGFLTDIRSRIVNRQSLNEIAVNIGLDKLVKLDNTQRRNPAAFKSANGNALEALVGAVYLDKGFDITKKFILDKVINENMKVEDVVQNDTNYKSKLIERTQKEGKELKFEIIEEKGMRGYKIFTAQIVIDGEVKGKGEGQSKKKAEQEAAKATLEILD